ncbi:hypothetical protein H4R18_000658 [Coemansia javaensis]|uniref:Cation-transporting P-type ATPase C-terminal domain-containing protein n=1 Tax=Coemansia javaensis TaxID=2761396 RepID=A0A9W8HHD5_9FUNG|nr:hypothetical protein H4R18_000658 [Coemansia javaensis]
MPEPSVSTGSSSSDSESAGSKADVLLGVDGEPGLGLSTAAAKDGLLRVLNGGRARIVLPPHFDVQSALVRVVAAATAATACALAASGAWLVAQGHPTQTRGIAALAEAGLLALAVAAARWVVARESALEARELDKRLRAVTRELRGWSGAYADLRTPQLPTVTAYTVLRDGVWRDVPTLLLVEGDLVALAYGEAAPCLVALCAALGPTAGHAEHRLARGQRLVPATMSEWGAAASPGHSSAALDHRPWDPRAAGHAQMAGRVLFVVLATPLASHLDQIALHHKRTERSVLQNQIHIVTRLLVLRVLPALAAAALAINIVIYGVVDVGQTPHRRMGVEAILAKTAYVVFPFACTVLWPVFWILARMFSSASAVVLFDTLQRSKTDYEDMEDIDEFDVDALPPTKDVRVEIGSILSHMRWVWSTHDHRNLSRSSNLSETLGTITVICSIDKEGTIAEPFCTPEQIVVPEKDDDYAVLDLAEQQMGAAGKAFIIDEGWERYLPSLRPMGLDCGLNTAAHGAGRVRTDSTTHRRHNGMQRHGRALPSQDTCLCRIGQGIGFAPDDLARYRLLKEVDVFAPFHQATESHARLGEFGAASFTSAIVRPARAPAGQLQMLTDGNVELVLGMCLDYFDGAEIRPLDDQTMAMYYSLYLNALQQDLQCLAFSYRPLAVDARCIQWAGWGLAESEAEAGADESSGVYVDLRLDTVITSAATTNSDAESSSEGSPGSSSESSSESGPGSRPQNNRLSRVSTSTSTSTSTNTSKSTGSDADQGPLIAIPEHLTEAARHALLRSKPKFARLQPGEAADDVVDYDSEALTLFPTEEEFLRDAVTEQIFLGMVTFAYEPKTDVCDFIEDLDIAGIRFVYFSRTKGRQSKSFAERLGLETDWNTCILLSSEAAGGAHAADDGYVEDHDIKARLPRGIENIRPHLEEVDDIPLQISLFAECTPEATREMIQIFQENGDVACCIGSALQDGNTQAFAVADLAVGVEPIPHFNRIVYGFGQGAALPHAAAAAPAAPAAAAAAAALRSAVISGHDAANDGSISTSGALVTQYALGAALTCIPCPLFLQHDTSLYTLMQVISEARRLLGSMQQAALLMALACLALAAVNLVAAACLLPPALPGFMLLWVLWAVVPALAATMLFVPRDESIMSTMPLKNHSHLVDMPRFAVYAVVRMLPPVVLTVAVYATALAALLPGAPPLGRLAAELGRADWLALRPDQQWAVLGAQTCAMVAFVFHCVCVSATVMHRTRTLVELVPLRNTVWAAGSALCLALTLAFAALLVAFGDLRIARVPWHSYVVAFAGPLVLLPLQDACKVHDRRRWTRLQKLAKLEFKTKLGLHSPL